MRKIKRGFVIVKNTITKVKIIAKLFAKFAIIRVRLAIKIRLAIVYHAISVLTIIVNSIYHFKMNALVCNNTLI